MIEFTFDEATGKAEVETKGIKGPSCKTALDKFKLGKIKKEKKSGEYFEPPAERSDLIDIKR